MKFVALLVAGIQRLRHLGSRANVRFRAVAAPPSTSPYILAIAAMGALVRLAPINLTTIIEYITPN